MSCCRMLWVSVNWCSWYVYDESVKINDYYASIMSRWWVGVELMMSRWWVGDNLLKIHHESVKIGDAFDDESVMCRWWVGENRWSWCVINDESVMNRWTSMIMMCRRGISNESGNELVIINDESVISRWKSMMRRLVGADSVMSRCLFRNSQISRYQGRIFPLTYYLNLPSPVTSTRTSVRLLY